MKFTARIVKMPPSAAEIMKQVNFGTAKGLTETAQEGQAAVVDALGSNFTLRGKWFEKNMKHGIKITPATKTKLRSEVKTAADWLEAHETGKDKTGRSHRISVPLWGARPRGSRKILYTKLRAAAMLASGKAFIIDTPKGEIVVTTKGGRIIPLYGLESKVKIKKKSSFYEPIEKVVKRSLKGNIAAGIRHAFATMR
jgi:hypothetical protein